MACQGSLPLTGSLVSTVTTSQALLGYSSVLRETSSPGVRGSASSVLDYGHMAGAGNPISCTWQVGHPGGPACFLSLCTLFWMVLLTQLISCV